MCRQLGSLLIINEGEVPNALPKWNRYSLSEVHDGQWKAERTGGTASSPSVVASFVVVA